MPHLVGLLAHRHAFDLALTFRIEQAQLDAFRVLGEQGEVDALSVPGRAERIWSPRPYRYERLHWIEPGLWSYPVRVSPLVSRIRSGYSTGFV